MPQTPPRVALLVTCLVDMFRPVVGFAAIKLLEEAGCTVVVPEGQSCCGQPGWNSGDRASAVALAKQVISHFAEFDHVVVPSGSCAAQIIKDYPQVLRDEPDWVARAEALSAKTHELVSFLTDVCGMTGVQARLDAHATYHATYHDSCSGLRSLGIKAQPRQLLASVAGLKLSEMAEAEGCCGFGGTFCVKYPEISNKMVSTKIDNAAATGADLVLAGDLGCLMNMAGKANRMGKPLKMRHVAEVLAGMTDTPAIGEKS